ncbi:Hypothetical protein SRAE_0000003100 [Strongyloides ratti]|uniref:Uncharacterized protein n=1 Tax=Strongyloides ratti TaxID=34506 RepID=A0A090L083_STRRB|nr:Hypothetical protein SRAE_0000003100 [Strongyloides ratti]CEF60899.1 Hypothetical protein SRAE_0000003100 [Strongyloides ratti]
MTDNNYECLFDVNLLDRPNNNVQIRPVKQMKPSTETGTLSSTNINPGTSTNFSAPDYFFPQKQASNLNNLPTANNSTPLTKSNTNSNNSTLTQEQIDQIEKILPNGQRTSLYMYYYNYYVRARPGRTKEYYENLVQQYIKNCKEHLTRLSDEKCLDRNRRLSSSIPTEVVIGPKFLQTDAILGNLFYWFGINKLNRFIKWHDTILDKDQNNFDKDEIVCYRRNAFLRKNWYYSPNEGFKYTSTSFEPHSIVMSSINQNSFTSFAYNCGYKIAQKKVFLEYTTTN